MIKPSGSIFYKDEYNTIYHVEWSTTGSIIDLTTITMQPFVWGKPSLGYIDKGIVYRNGIVTVLRQAIKVTDGGYAIIAEGTSQYEDYIQTNYPCSKGPADNFKYHLDSALVDETDNQVTSGSRWADVADDNDTHVIWGDINQDGSPVDVTSATDVSEILEWIDVWS